MKSIKRLLKSQPPTKKKVVELVVGGRVGRWFSNHGWGAFTLPLPFLVLIFYWSNKTPVYDFDVEPLCRVHEFVHVAQDERNLCFAVSWWDYYRSMWKHFAFTAWRYGHVSLSHALMDAYYANDYEAEAYAVEAAAEQNGLPAWAK